MKLPFILCVMVGVVFVSGCLQTGFPAEGTETPAGTLARPGPVYGYVFDVDGKYYMVTEGLDTVAFKKMSVLTEDEIKSVTHLNDISPFPAGPSLSSEEAKDLLNKWFLELVGELEDETKNFDLEKCVEDYKNLEKNQGVGIANISSLENICNADYNRLVDVYNIVSSGETKGPVLVHLRPGDKVFWRGYFVSEGKVIYSADINSNGQHMGFKLCSFVSPPCEWEWVSGEEAKSILIDYLSQKGIEYTEISDAAYMEYYPA